MPTPSGNDGHRRDAETGERDNSYMSQTVRDRERAFQESRSRNSTRGGNTSRN